MEKGPFDAALPGRCDDWPISINVIKNKTIDIIFSVMIPRSCYQT